MKIRYFQFQLHRIPILTLCSFSLYDVQVMLIAKSYYGKKVRHGIKRLAEGKYRIAGKIVFVRVSSFYNSRDEHRLTFETFVSNIFCSLIV